VHFRTNQIFKNQKFDAMARPKKELSDLRGTRVNARCTIEEKQKIERAAQAAKLSTSEYLIRAALGKKITVSTGKAVPPELISNLNAVGNNLNQMMRHCHATGNPPPPDLPPLLTYIQAYVLKHLPK